MRWIVPLTCAISLLYFGREAREPLVLATILTLVMLPLVRRIRRIGALNTIAVLISLGLVASGVIGVSSIIATQVADVIREMPRYEAEIHPKIEQVADMTLRPLARLESSISGLAPRDLSVTES